MTRQLVRGPFFAAAAQGTLVAVGVLLVALGLVAPMPASAATGSLVDIVNANAPTKAAGGQFDAVQLTAPAACDARATRHLAHIVAVTSERASDAAAARKWVGDNLYGTASAGLPGPLTLRSNGSWQQLADAYGQKLVAGTYTIELRCQDNLAQTIYQRWTGDVTFTSPTSWRGYVAKGGAAAAGSRKPSAATTASAPAASRSSTTTASSTPTPGSSAPSSGASSSVVSPSGAAIAPGSASPTTPVSAGSTTGQSARSSDPSLRKDAVIGIVLVLAAAALMLRLWQRQRPYQTTREQS